MQHHSESQQPSRGLGHLFICAHDQAAKKWVQAKQVAEALTVISTCDEVPLWALTAARPAGGLSDAHMYELVDFAATAAQARSRRKISMLRSA